MGRRKIEIQPITNERNRSVTFLKRKNGLFKKAHELGVLCSVDVAVIIFDERHGHDTKLFQYSSMDVREIVQRHLRHNGERDTKGPADFSDNPVESKNDTGGDGDEDDDEVEGDESAGQPPKKTSPSSKHNMDDDEYKPSSTRVITEPAHKQRAAISNERSVPERPRSSLALDTFPTIPQYEHQHPLSSDRLHPMHHQRPYDDVPQNKKPRLDYPLNMNISHLSRSEHGQSPEDSLHRSTINRGLDDFYGGYHPSQQLRPRHPSDASHHLPQLHHSYGSYDLGYPSSPSTQHRGPGGYGPPQYNGPPPSEFSMGPSVSSWVRNGGVASNGSPTNTSGLSFFAGPGPGGHLGPASFNGLPPSGHAHHQGPYARADEPNAGRDSASSEGMQNLASAFLEADQQQRKAPHSQNGGPLALSRGSTSAASFGLDWPDHHSRPQPSQPPHTIPIASSPVTPAPKPDVAAAADGKQPGAADATSDVGWLDLLSSGASSSGAGENSMSRAEGSIPTPRSGSADPGS